MIGWRQWIVDAISFQKIYGLSGLKGRIVDKRWGVTTVAHTHTDARKCEDRVRILEAGFTILLLLQIIISK